MGKHDTKDGRLKVNTVCINCNETCCPFHSVIVCLDCIDCITAEKEGQTNAIENKEKWLFSSIVWETFLMKMWKS